MVMQETTFAWPEDELDSDDGLPTRRERREQERRDHIDTPAPTALTLLELEPPSIDEVQEPATAPVPGSIASSATETSFETASTESTSTESGSTPQSMFSPEFSGTFEPEPAFASNVVPAAEPLVEPLATEPLFDTPMFDTPVFDTPTFDEDRDDDDFAETDLPFPLAAKRAASLQDRPDSDATSGARVGGQSAAGSFDWSRPDTPEAAGAPRATLLTQEAPAPVRVVTVPSKGTHNAAVWMIALVPLVQLVVSLLILTALGAAVPSAAMVAVWLAPYPLVVILAAIDRALLKRSGHKKTAHWLWALLTAPIYLIVRAVASIRESGGGFGPVLVWAVLGLLHIASIIAVPGLLISAIPTVFAQQAQQSIVSDAAIIGTSLKVTCPAPAVLVGQTFTCAGTTSTDKPLSIDVSLQRVNGWIDWRVDDWGIYTLG